VEDIVARSLVLVGCGSMAPAWLDVLTARSDVTIVGLVDIALAAAESTAARYQLGCPVYDDLGTAVSTAQPEVVVDVTVPDAHRAVTTTALAAGAHVLGEKPMSTNLADARDMVAAAEAARGTYAVMQNRRYDAGVRALRDVVAGGALGPVSIVSADFFLAPHFGGFREQMASPLLVDMAVHTFDQARFVTGVDPVDVFCREHAPPGSWFAGAGSAVCTFTMSDGSLFSYRGSWCAPGHATSWQASWRVAGTRGSACWDGEGSPTVEVAQPAGPAFIDPVDQQSVDLSWTGPVGHAGCIDEMLAAIAAGRPSDTAASDNIRSVAMVFAALESARTGAVVPVEW
jgi:predicted dehydrogenase